MEFSRNGQVMFAGYEDYTVRAWDVLKASDYVLEVQCVCMCVCVVYVELWCGVLVVLCEV